MAVIADVLRRFSTAASGAASYGATVSGSAALASGLYPAQLAQSIATAQTAGAYANRAADREARLLRYKVAWQAYRGEWPDSLKPNPDGSNDNVVLNLARPIVNVGVSWLFGHEIGFELDAQTDTPAEQALDSFWAANRKMLTLQKLATNGAVCGHVFVKLVPAAPTNDPTASGEPRLVVLDPAMVDVEWAPDDIERVERYLITWRGFRGGVPRDFRQVIARDGPAAWVILEQESAPESTAWRDVAPPQRWPYPLAPIIDCQNLPIPNEFYGEADLTPDLLSPLMANNAIMSNVRRILRFHAHPKTIASGVQAAQLQLNVDGVLCLPTPDGRVFNVELQSDLASSLAAELRMRDYATVVSETPAIALGLIDEVGVPSGVSLAVRYQTLIQKTERKRRTYGYLIDAIHRLRALLLGLDPDVLPAIHWPELLPGDAKEEAEVLTLDISNQIVSRQTASEQRGYSWEIELPRLQAEQAAAAARQQALTEAAATAFDRGAL
jgi:hypothetical protein